RFCRNRSRIPHFSLRSKLRFDSKENAVVKAHLDRNDSRRALDSSISTLPGHALAKHLLRTAAARTIESICPIGAILGAFTAEDCANYCITPSYPTLAASSCILLKVV